MKLKVHVRLRPRQGESIVKTEHALLYLTDPVKRNTSEFVFDGCFEADAAQEHVSDEVGKPLVDHVLAGFNACCFVYGQNGSGKSHSVFGGEGAERGLAPRAAEQLFRAIAERGANGKRGSGGGAGKLSVFVSFLEIRAGEQIWDLGYAAAAAAQQQQRRQRGSGSGIGGGVDRNNLEIYEDDSGLTLVRDLTYIEVSSSEDVMAVLKAGYDMRQAASPQGEASSSCHTVFTMSVVQHREGVQPITGRLHFVDLACSDAQASSMSLAALGKVLAALAAQSSQLPQQNGFGNGSSPTRAYVPFRDSKLTLVLKDSLQGNCHVTLLATLNPSAGNHDACFSTLQFAVRCQGTDVAPSVSKLPSSGAARSGGAVHDAAVQGLVQQVAALKQELDFTHAHYQKLIESVAGPHWAADAGPVERAEGSGSEGGAAGGAGAGGAGVTGNGTSAGGAAEASRAPGGAGSVAALELKLRRLEQQLAASSSRLSSSEARLASKRVEAEDFRERMMSKDFSQVNEMKRLREQLAAAKATLQEAQGLGKHKEEQAQRRFDEECARLVAENEALRSQIAAMSVSVNSMMETRSSKALAAKQQRDTLVNEAERRLKEQIAITVAEKDRQLENLRSQSTYHLARKSEEIAALREELAAVRAKSEAEVSGLTAEAEYLISYADKLTEVLRRMESGVYGVVERGGLRQFKVPSRDKPGPLSEDRLRMLRSAVDGVDRLVAATAAAAAGAPSIAPSSTAAATGVLAGTASSSLPPTSRVQSASASHAGGAAAAAAPMRRSSGAADLDEGSGSSWGLGTDLEALKAQWEAEMRGSITSQVVSDLKSDKTVEYIRSLESQVAKYRQELQAQKRQSNEMTVALRSVQRVQSRPGSAINAAISGSPLPRPPTWGLGHTPASVHAASSENGYGRPNTASATMQAAPRGTGSPPLTASVAYGAGSLGRSGSWGFAPGSVSVGGGGNGLSSYSPNSSGGGAGFIRENGMSY